ncbi:MAG: carbohydrate kinase family protein [Firmicutes bacterium]|nr:carbohydrate kinase family protein [Bacillota bacterium]
MSKAICFGITCLDILVPGLDPSEFYKETIRLNDFSYSTGGDAINEAVTLAKLGHEPVLMTVLADDAMGRLLTDLARSRGVNMDHVKKARTHQTAVSIVCVHKDGERNFIVNNGSDNEIGEGTADWDAAKDAGVFCVGSAYGAKGLTESLPAVLKRAKELGLTTCVDIMIGSEYVGKESEADPAAFLKYADYIFPNQSEARWMTGETDPDAMAEKLLAMGAGCVVLKDGENGCCLYRKPNHGDGGVIGKVFVSAVRCEVVDTTGAGDNFLAGFTAGLLEGKSDEDCAKLATATASASVRYLGAAGLKDRAEVEEILKEMRP